MSHILVTGASSGIGAAAAAELTRLGHSVLLVARSPTKLDSVHRQLRSLTEVGADPPKPIVSDFSSLNDVEHLARIVADRFPEIDVLVNNAGIQPCSRRVSADGFELTLAVNHLAPFLLTNLLSEVLESNRGRVVTTSSSNHATGRFNFTDLQLERHWTMRSAYDRSKLANLLFSLALSKRTRLPSTAFHPGTVSTDLNRESRYVPWVKPLEKLVMSTPKKGADTLVWLATNAEGGDPAAPYYVNRKPHSISPMARDEDLGNRLWEVSAELIGRSRLPEQ